MAQRVEIRDVTIPPGTLQTSPQITNFTWREGYPVRVEIRFPPGPSGFVGVRIRHGGTVIVPRRGSNYLVADNEVVDWALEDLPSNANYNAQAYNEGVYSHTIQFRFHLNELGGQKIERTPTFPVTVPIRSPGTLLEGLEVL